MVNLLTLSNNTSGRGSSVGIKSTSQAVVPHPAYSFVEKKFPSSADSRRASYQLLAKEWVLNTGKLPPGGLPRNSVISN